MKIVVGLGNPGKAYNFTRHNFGFLALDYYAKVSGFSFAPSGKWAADIAKHGDALFVKPTTFYNLVGRPVSAIARFYKVPLSDVLVVCDDFALPFGDSRYRSSGSAGGNNGLRSIIENMGTDEFARLRIGTDSPLRSKICDTDFVLSKFSPEERDSLSTILQQVSLRVNEFLAQ